MDSLPYSEALQSQIEEEKYHQCRQFGELPHISSQTQTLQKIPAHQSPFQNVDKLEKRSQNKSSQKKPALNILYTEEQISFYREVLLNNLLDCMNKMNLKCPQIQEIAVVILSQLISYTPKIQQYSKYLIGFVINEACFSSYNSFTPSQHIFKLKNEINTYKNCFDIFTCLVPFININSESSIISEYDQIHYLLRNILTSEYLQPQSSRYSGFSNNELQFRLNHENTTFAHLSKILQNIQINENDLETIQEFLKQYWEHEELFYNYKGEMVANALLKIVRTLECTDADLSSFGNIDLLSQIHTPQWISEYKKCCIDYFQFSQFDLPEDLQTEIEIENDYQEYPEVENYEILDNSFGNLSEIKEQYDQGSAQKNFSVKCLSDFNIDQIQINSNLDNYNQSSSNNFKQANQFQEEKNENSISTFIPTNNNYNYDYLDTKTPEKKHPFINGKSIFSQNSDSIGKQIHNNNIFNQNTGETKSSSISNFSLYAEENNCSSNLKAQIIKQYPASFNHHQSQQQQQPFSQSQLSELNY